MYAHLFCVFLLSTIVESGTTSLSSPPTCPSRTVNYITHALPQQCLPTGRFNNATTDASTLSDSTTTNFALAETTANSTSQSPSLTTLSATVIDQSVFGHPHPLSTADATTTVKELVVPESIREEDSALESGEFLSFEEWKKQNLEKAGQSEHVGQRHQGESQEQRQRPSRQQNALESLGEDGEIDIDFAGFVPSGPTTAVHEASQPITDEQNDPPVAKPKLRSRDAGTTCKERFNYASFDCAANVLKWNKEAKSPSSVLSENKDSYMLNQCSAENKFLILELCNDILIDTVVIANFEFFSSTFRTFRVSVSDSYPVKGDKWKVIGNYEARNTREVQAFLVENPIIWARYLRIEFLSHYGAEFYCPVSLVRVHGTTMMEEWKHSEDSATIDDGDDEAGTEELGLPESSNPAPQPETETQLQESAVDSIVASLAEKSVSEQQSVGSTSQAAVRTNPGEFHVVRDPNGALIDSASPVAIEAIIAAIESSETCGTSESHVQTASASPTDNVPRSHLSRNENSTQHIVMEGIASRSSDVPDLRTNATEQVASQTSAMEKSQSVASGSIPVVTTKSNISTTDRAKSSSTVSSAASAPTAQDSFFKSVQKRLQMLEANSSLSLQYIEDQSRALRDAFKKVEQRQLARTSNFLEALNQTVLNELREFRQQYDQLWQSTVIELESQRERYERDNEAINTRIGLLADEVIFQRRMAIMQMVLIVVCLVLVLFSRGAINNYLELPLVQNMLTRSPSSRWLNLSSSARSPERPAPPNRVRSALELQAQSSTHDHKRQKSGDAIEAQQTNDAESNHQRMSSKESIDALDGNELYAPPTPVSDYGGPPDFDPSTIERPATSPPTLRVNDEVGTITDISEEEITSPVSREEEPLDSLPNGLVTAVPSTIRDSSPGKHLTWALPER